VKRPAHLVAAVSILAVAACSSNGDSAPPPAALTLSAVAWNPSNLDVGSVQAVAEQEVTLLLFGSKGVLTLTSGAVVSSDETITTWRSAAVIPSADGLSSWMIGVDDQGHLQRVRSGGRRST